MVTQDSLLWGPFWTGYYGDQGRNFGNLFRLLCSVPLPVSSEYTSLGTHCLYQPQFGHKVDPSDDFQTFSTLPMSEKSTQTVFLMTFILSIRKSIIFLPLIFSFGEQFTEWKKYKHFSQKLSSSSYSLKTVRRVNFVPKLRLIETMCAQTSNFKW